MTGMKEGARARILVLSSRPDLLRAVTDAAAGIDPSPEVRGLFGRPLEVLPTDLILVDIAEPRATMPYLHRRFGPASAFVALIDVAWVDRLGSALAEDWTDYLFHPLNAAELGFVWQKHTSPGDAPDLNLDVDESGHIRVAFPSDVRYQRAVVERVVVACRHLGELDREAAFRLRVTLGEAVANAILYGSGDRPGAVVRVSAKAHADGLRVKVSDEGSGFDPSAVPDPVSAEGIGRPRGRGLFLLRQLADGVTFNEAGNAVTLSFRGAPEPLLARRQRRERVLAELEVARDLQLKLLPPPEDFRDLGRVAARCDPALSLGGDFYYLVRFADGCLGAMLGDVSSHGPSAALIMALTLSAVVVATRAEAEPAAVLDAMHGQLRAALDATEMYMTLFYGVLDPGLGELRYANAGHPYAYLLGSDGVRRLEALDPPVGVTAVRAYREMRVPSARQTLLAFTDGLAELSDPLDTPDSRVRRRIDRGDLDPEVLVDVLFADSDDEMRLDDRTAVAACL